MIYSIFIPQLEFRLQQLHLGSGLNCWSSPVCHLVDRWGSFNPWVVILGISQCNLGLSFYRPAVSRLCKHGQSFQSFFNSKGQTKTRLNLKWIRQSPLWARSAFLECFGFWIFAGNGNPVCRDHIVIRTWLTKVLRYVGINHQNFNSLQSWHPKSGVGRCHAVVGIESVTARVVPPNPTKTTGRWGQSRLKEQRR